MKFAVVFGILAVIISLSYSVLGAPFELTTTYTTTMDGKPVTVTMTNNNGKIQNAH